MNKFTVAFSYEIEDGVEIGVVVSGIVIPYTPENKRGHPDHWTPAEPGYLEDLEVKNSLGTPLPSLIQERLVEDDDFLKAVENELKGENE